MKILSCEFNIDTACVELRLTDGTLISIDCTAVENEVADNMYQRSELDWLIYNDPAAYADLILNCDPETYQKTAQSISRWTNGEPPVLAPFGAGTGGSFTFFQSVQTQQLADLDSILTSVPATSAETR